MPGLVLGSADPEVNGSGHQCLQADDSGPDEDGKGPLPLKWAFPWRLTPGAHHGPWG